MVRNLRQCAVTQDMIFLIYKNQTSKKIAFERIVRHIPTTKYGNVNMVNIMRNDTGMITSVKSISDTNYLISTEEILEMGEIQLELTNLINKTIPANLENPLYEGDITESTIGQEVPEMPTLDLEKLFYEDEETQSTIILDKKERSTQAMLDDAINETLNDTNGTAMDDTMNTTMNTTKLQPSIFIPFDSEEETTVDQLDSSMLRFNQATIDPNDSNCSTLNSSWSLPNLSRSTYIEDLNVARTFEEDYEIINSTQNEAIVPNLSINEKPIRERRRPDFYQAN